MKSTGVIYNLFHSSFWKWLIGFALIFLSGKTWAQAYFYVSGQHKKVSVPYNYSRNLIIVPVYLNGQGPFNFILDTGVGVTSIVDPALADTLGLKRLRKIEIYGWGKGTSLTAYVVTPVVISMHGIRSEPFSTLVFQNDPFLLTTYLGIKISGILGYEFFSSFAVSIHYPEKRMEIYEPGKFKADKRSDCIPLHMAFNKSYIDATCDLKDSSKLKVSLLLDTGSGFPLSLLTFSDPKINLPPRNYHTELGIGINGEIDGAVARIRDIRVGKYDLTDVITSFPDTFNVEVQKNLRNGSIGNFMLKRFNAVFDYPDSSLYLKPNAEYHDPFEYDKTGMDLVAASDDLTRVIVYHVKPNSPAAEFGIKENDELLVVNQIPVKTLSLGEIDQIFSDAKAKRVYLTILRGNQVLNFTLPMRDLI